MKVVGADRATEKIDYMVARKNATPYTSGHHNKIKNQVTHHILCPMGQNAAECASMLMPGLTPLRHLGFRHSLFRCSVDMAGYDKTNSKTEEYY
ncbi:MAG: hypothetical protein P1V13_09060 [Rhizobiaceae bacterium]|nr:hypothetical protein [Rhizobiaceae bacterium]